MCHRLIAVQFENNWKKKFGGLPKLDEAVARVQFGFQGNSMNPIQIHIPRFPKLDKYVHLLFINYVASVSNCCREFARTAKNCI